MKLKHATLIAIVGQVVYLAWIIGLNLDMLDWSETLGLILNVLYHGSIINFLATLFLKQK